MFFIIFILKNIYNDYVLKNVLIICTLYIDVITGENISELEKKLVFYPFVVGAVVVVIVW